MQYVIMFAMVVMASIVDIVTGIIKAHITNSYDSTIMKNGLYSKALNWLVMMFSIGCEVGMSMLGKYYQCETIAGFAGAIASASEKRRLRGSMSGKRRSERCMRGRI